MGVGGRSDDELLLDDELTNLIGTIRSDDDELYLEWYEDGESEDLYESDAFELYESVDFEELYESDDLVLYISDERLG